MPAVSCSFNEYGGLHTRTHSHTTCTCTYINLFVYTYTYFVIIYFPPDYMYVYIGDGWEALSRGKV